MRSALKSKWLSPAALTAVLLCAAHAPAQEPAADENGYDGSRQIKYSGFSSRPPAANKKTPPPAPVYERVDAGKWKPGPRQKAAAAPQPAPERASNTPKRPRHTSAPPRQNTRTATPRPAQPAESDYVDIGVTIWNLQPGRLADAEDGVSFLTPDGAQFVTPVRNNGTEVQLGDRVRFSIESPRAGYLYVINRTQYTDNSVEEPELIYPTARTGGDGDNRVKPGHPVFIPALEEKYPYFRVTAESPNGKVNAGEVVNIIYSPRPIPELSKLSVDKVRISRQMVEKWASTWGDMARQEQLNLVGSEGKPATVAEHEAGKSGGGARALTQEAPKPQLLFRLRANPNGPAMVTLHLTYGNSASGKN